MFGYIICNRQGLSEEERFRYEQTYCGLCHALKNEFGLMERFTLNFDMTFLAIFLAALYEPEEQTKEFRCVLHPTKKKCMLQNRFTEYAAAMTVALSYYKCLDDWKDERKYHSRAYAALLKKSYCKTESLYPRQCRVLSESLQRLGEVEKEPEASVDEALRLSGRMISEMFVYKEDFWSSSLRHFGYELGRFIYLMDAAMDYEQDKKTGNYNPIIKMERKPEDMRGILEVIMGSAAEEFEKLPVVKDANLIRNILYGGVWQKYNAAMASSASGKKDTQ